MSPTSKKRETYTVRCVREDDWWIVTVDELDGVFTHARRIDQVEDLARDAIALWLEVEPDTFDIVIEVDIYGQAGDARDAALEARATAEEARSLASFTTTDAVVKLIGAGLPMRDVGALLDISHQRVAQIMGEEPASAAGKTPAKARATKPASRASKTAASKSVRSGKTAGSLKVGRSGRYVVSDQPAKRVSRRG